MASPTDWQDGDTHLTSTDEDTAPTSSLVPALTVLAHPDARRVGERIALPALAVGREVRLSRLEPDFQPPGAKAAGRPLAERTVSRRPIRLQGVPGRPGAVLLDARETRTRLTVEGETVTGELLVSAADVGRGTVLQMGRDVVLLLHRVHLPFPEAARRFGFWGESGAVVRLCQELDRLASLDVPVLLRGESGTGKELAARALHDAGPRAGGPFVAVNMATLSASLAAAELFGAVRGAYTGADRKKTGFFQAAQGGTLFLDEIGEAPAEVQAMLLRALESREVLPVGSVDAQRVDVRVIAATDARLEEAMTEGRFRAPLFHRLAGYAVQLPALRERRDDVGRLLWLFLEEELATLGRKPPEDGERSRLPAEVVARLARHEWPGNVRELKNAARRLAIGGPLDEAAVLLGSVGNPRSPTPETPPEPPATEPLRREPAERSAYRDPSEVGEDELLAALVAHQYRIQPAAAALGVSRTSLYALIDACPRIRKAADLSREEIEAAALRCGRNLAAAAEALGVSLQGLKMRLRELGLRP